MDVAEHLIPLRPKQARSRARLKAILDAAEAEVAEKGMAGLTMSGVAERAQIPIGSLYQYVPSEQALLRGLTERFLESWRNQLGEVLSGAKTPEALSHGLVGVMREIGQEMRGRPERGEIWRQVQADRELAALDLADTRANAALIALTLAKMGVVADPKEAIIDTMLVIQLSMATAQLASMLGPEEADRIIDSFSGIMLHKLGLPAATRS